MASDATPATIPSALSLSDIDTTVNHEPRIRDLRLAEVLGMANPHAIRRMIKRHANVLKTFGDLFSHQDAKIPEAFSDLDLKIGRGRPSSSFYLTKRQALYLTAKAETPRAAMVTVEMVELFDRFTTGQAGGAADMTGQPITLTEQEIALVLAFRIQVERAVASQVDARVRDRVRRNAVAAGLAVADIVCGDMVFDGDTRRFTYTPARGAG